MENLTKQQIVLLCLLVALFTSIATSVITASLFDQTSQGFTQTIYKVVERTIDEVTSKDSPVRKIIEKDSDQKPAPEKSSIPLETIVTNTDQSLVGIWSRTGRENGTFVSPAVVVGGKKNVLALNGYNIFDNVTYVLRQKNGGELEMRKIATFQDFAILGPVNPETFNLKGLTLDSLYSESLGANVIAIGSKEQNNVVSTGIVAEFPLDGNDTLAENRDDAVTDIKLSSVSSGWLLLSTSGKVVGLIKSIYETNKGATYIGAQLLESAFPDLF